MPMDFPSSPTVGQQYNGYVWDGTAWDSTSAQPISLSTTAPGYNYVINGGFDIWQRGTSFNGATYNYTADRWEVVRGAFTAGATFSRQASGLTGAQYCMRVQRDSGNTSTQYITTYTAFETSTSIPLAGKTVTLSFYARAGANLSSSINYSLRTGTGTDQGAHISWTNESFVINNVQTLSAGWVRYFATAVVPSNSTQLGVNFTYTPTGTAGAADYFEVTGVQLEEGGAATAFRRNAPSIQAELAACQRYYYRITGPAVGSPLALPGSAFSTTNCMFSVPLPVTMRTTPSGSFDWTGSISNYKADNFGGGAPSTPTLSSMSFSNYSTNLLFGVMTGTGFTVNYEYPLEAATANAYLGFSAEL